MEQRGRPSSGSDGTNSPEQGELFGIAVAHEGPLPLPELFRGYEDVLPGAADRILTMAERAQQASVDARLIPVRAEATTLKMATFGVTFLPWFLIGLAALLLVTGHEVGAIVAGLAGLVGGGPQVIAATRRPRQRKG